MAERTVTRTYRVDNISRSQRRPSTACVTLEEESGDREPSFVSFCCAVGEIPRPDQQITVKFTWEVP